MEHYSEIEQLLKLGAQSQAFGFEHAEIESSDSEPAMAVMPMPDIQDQIASAWQKIARWKGLVIYPVIFVVAFVFFYFVLNYSSIFAQVQGYFTKPQNEEILGEQLTAYNKWIGGYYYSISNSKLLDPTNDIDKDGLTNMDEFVMRTNPTLADSDADGFSDGIEVINSMNPWGSGPMTKSQLKLAEGLDAIVINNRISYGVAVNTGIRGAVASTSVSVSSNYDLNKPGRLSIPRLNLSVPLVWSKEPADFEKDLSTGVIHYPGTALPGEQGTVYVSGHSSDYIWKKDPYHAVFAQLNYLKPGDDIFIDVYGSDGKIYNYRYQVESSKIYRPDDQTQFIDNSAFKLNLSTCWPIGTQKDRYVVSALQKPL